MFRAGDQLYGWGSIKAQVSSKVPYGFLRVGLVFKAKGSLRYMVGAWAGGTRTSSWGT